jgi:hypothetical protein
MSKGSRVLAASAVDIAVRTLEGGRVDGFILNTLRESGSAAEAL